MPSSAASIALRGAFAAACLLASAQSDLRAQPAPSFRASCQELRAAADRLKTDDGLVTIEVVDALTAVSFDGALAYLAMCAPPNPLVLCITYSTGGRKAGERASLTGNYSRAGPDHILLDPCLPSEAD